MADAVLTEEEAAVALAVALAKKQAALDADRLAAAEAEQQVAARKAAERLERANAKDRQERPHRWVGAQYTWGVVTYYPNAREEHTRTITIGGLTFEHSRNDADGVAIYRHLG